MAQETVYLRNGSVIKGTVADNNENNSVTVITKDGNVLVYDTGEVLNITRSNLYTGYRGFVDIAFHFMDCYGAMFSTVHGGYVLPYLYVGGGASFGFRTAQNDYDTGLGDYYGRWYHWNEGFQINFPLFLNLRGYYPLKSGSGGPFIDSRLGFHVVNIGINCMTTSSFFTCLAFGWNWNTGNSAWSFSSGWQFENEFGYRKINQWVARFGYEF